MSRIGRAPITLPAGVTVDFKDKLATVKGPLGTLTQTIDHKITVKTEGNVVTLYRADEQQQTKALHGLYRALIHNMVVGVSKGFEKGLVIAGVGFKVASKGANKIQMDIGYSHPVEFEAKAGIKLECPSITEITVKGISKEEVGQTAATIRSLRKPEPYHGYGIHYKDEVIEHKEGKTAGK